MGTLNTECEDVSGIVWPVRVIYEFHASEKEVTDPDKGICPFQPAYVDILSIERKEVMSNYSSQWTEWHDYNNGQYEQFETESLNDAIEGDL